MNKEIDLVIVGDIAYEKDITKHGTRTSKGGSCYYSSVGASKFSSSVGVISRVGEDFDMTSLASRGIDTRGVQVVKGGNTAQFTVYHKDDGTREFTSERGVAEEFYPTPLEADYQKTKHIHFSTSLPQRYLAWIRSLRDNPAVHAEISVDAFEAFAKSFPEETKLAMRSANIIFMNEDEMEILQGFGYPDFTIPTVIKYGKRGAEYRHNDTVITVMAPDVEAIDTTGAGDVLAGAFLAQRVKNIPIDQSLENAVYVASNSVRDFGVDHL